MADEKLLLDADAIQRGLTRIAHEIAEANADSKSVGLIGIQRGGVHLANRLAGLLTGIWGHDAPVGVLDVSMHRDDIGQRGIVSVQPTEVPFDVAALIGCSIATGVGAVVNDARVQPGRSAVVIGAGGVGLSIIMGLALAGASPIIAADVTDEALELAKQFGATHTVRSGSDLAERVREIVPDGADFAFEAIGRPETIALMPSTVQRGGTAVIVGLPPQDRPAPIDALALAEEGKALLGSNYGGTVPARDFPMLARLYLDGRLPVDRLITNRFALDDVNEAFDLMRAGAKGRSVLVM